MKKAKFKTACWIWPYGVNGSGYGIVKCKVTRKWIDAHKFMFELLKRKVPANCELDHTCNNKLCINPEHLKPVSHAENCRRGKQTKLTKKDVRIIRGLSGKFTQQEIANRFDVTRQSIGYILQGKRWI